MGWEDLLDNGFDRSLPWLGSRRVHDTRRTWTIQGAQPPEHGWYKFETRGGRYCVWLGNGEPDPSYEEGQTVVRGYLVGDRIISDSARVDPDPTKLIVQTTPVFCVEPGLDRFTRAVAVKDRENRLVYIRAEFPLGPEEEVRRAYQDRLPDVAAVKGVTPALDLAFRWISHQRELQEERRRDLDRIRQEEEQKRAEEERITQAMKDAGTALGRRVLAARDFDTAAREALRVSGAELLDSRPSYAKGEMVVQYRFMERRLECVVEKKTLRVVDAGICLTDHTGTKGDTFFTLESIPGVVAEAMRLGKLVVYRHVPGDVDNHDHDFDDDDW